MTPEKFWQSRDVLQHILLLSRARMVGPWAVLGYAMANAVGTIPHGITLPAIVGGRASLNLFVAVVGPSGDGKGAAAATARDGLNFGIEVETAPLGSGEGISRTFRPHGTERDADNPCAAAVFSAPEVDTLAAIGGRTGSTLNSELRKMYGGEQIGFGNSGKETRNVVAAGSYRACLTVGVQPLRSDALLGSSDGGLPQRFVWLPASDADAPDHEPDAPATMNIKRPSWERTAVRDLEVPDVARSTIREHRRAVLRGEDGVDPLDGHAYLTCLKVAVALMALEGRAVVSEEDWTLAGYVMSVSAQTRQSCSQALHAARRDVNKARAMDAVAREYIADDSKRGRAQSHILNKLAKHMQQTGPELRNTANVSLRDHVPPALAELLDSGRVTVSPGMRGTRTVQLYELYSDQKQSSSREDGNCTAGTAVRAPLKLADADEPAHRRRDRNTGRASQQTGEATA
jgi:hypothetical protein